MASDFDSGRKDHTTGELNAAAERARLLGDERSKEELGALMRPYVVAYLRSIKGSYTREQRDEMTQAAWMGIWEALGRWTNDGRKFSGYAYFFMKGEVQDWLAKNTGVLPVPRQAWANARNIETIVVEETNGEKMPYDLHDDELADILFERDAGNTRRVRSAGDLFRARRDAYVVDPNFEPRSMGNSPEDEHLDEEHNEDDDALLALELIGEAKDEDAAWTIALEFIDKHDLPIEVAERLMEA